MQGIPGLSVNAGNRPTKIDSTLANIRTKAGDLHARLEELRDGVGQLRDGIGPRRHETWYTFLKRFNTVKKSTSALTEELDRALTEGLDNFATVPAALTMDSPRLPELLRTKLELEVDRDFQALHKMFAAQAKDPTTTASVNVSATAMAHSMPMTSGMTSGMNSGTATHPAGAQAGNVAGNVASGSRAVETAAVKSRIEAFNEVVDNAVDRFDDLRAILNSPRQADAPLPPPSNAAECVLHALSTGRGLQLKG